MTPQRIQLRRTKGWRKPENTVVVARPSAWGNPYAVRRGDDLIPFDDDCGPGGTWHVVDTEVEGYTCPDVGIVSAWPTKAEAVTSAVACYRYRATEAPGHWNFVLWKIDTLRGKNLGCWCPLDQPCHADVLLELANNPESLTACTPPPAVTTPHQPAPGAGAPPGSPTPPRVELGGTNECEAP